MAMTRALSGQLLIAALALANGGCHLILPYESKPVSTTAYKCSAQFYRAVAPGTLFTEEWEAYIVGTQPGVTSDCEVRIDQDMFHLKKYAAPNDWQHTPVRAVPVLSLGYNECDENWDHRVVTPPAFGAPVGAEIRWNYPSELEATAFISVVGIDGVVRTARPKMANVAIDFAERIGMLYQGVYYVGKPHIRFADVSIELDTPFMLGADVKVTKFYLKSVGAIIAAHAGGTSYEVEPDYSRFYVWSEGEVNGQKASSGFCVSNDRTYVFSEYQGAPYATFAFSNRLEANFGGMPMTLEIHLARAGGAFSFKTHQPHVALLNRSSDFPADLAPDVAVDLDGDLTRFLWFEDFEFPSERFLGEGMKLQDVAFDERPEHTITLVAYDSKGAYSTARMLLTRAPNYPPVATDGSWAATEDQTLVVAAKDGVLEHAVDPNGDFLTARLTVDAQHGSVALQPDGSFVYQPAQDWFGEDQFQYVANDGRADSNVAIARISVAPVNDSPVANPDSYTTSECTPLLVAAPGLLTNDSDVDTPLSQLTATKVGGPQHGSATVAPDGSFVYDPAPSFSGQDAFTYRVSDGIDVSKDATVTLTVLNLTPAEEIRQCIEAAIPPGTLTDGQTNSLLTKLETAVAKYLAGQAAVACNLVRAFINEVNSLVADGDLAASTGQDLVARAMHVAGEMGCK